MLLEAATIGKESMVSLEFVITIIAGLIATGTAFLTLKFGHLKLKEKTEDKFETIEKQFSKEVNDLKNELSKEVNDLKAEILSIKAGKNAMRKDMERKHEKAEKILHGRVDKLQTELKEDRINNNKEFNSINRELGEIKTGIESIKNMLSK